MFQHLPSKKSPSHVGKETNTWSILRMMIYLTQIMAMLPLRQVEKTHYTRG